MATEVMTSSEIDIKPEPLMASSDHSEDEEHHAAVVVAVKTEVAHENGFNRSSRSNNATPDDYHTYDGSMFVERYKCHHCDKSYKNIRSLNQHFREVQVCRVCKKCLPSVEAFTSHILEDHTVGALCGICMGTFRSRARLVEHVSTHTQPTLKKPDVNRVRKHVPAAEAKTCKLCRQELSPLSPHTCHANVCKLCRKPLRTRNEFEVHMMRLHCTEDSCQFCGARLSSVPSLISHLKSHTSLRYPAHKCTKCGLRFSSEARLSAHDCKPGAHNSPSKFNSPYHHKLCDVSNKSPDKNSSAGDRHNIGDSPKPLTPETLKHECPWCEDKFRYLRDLKRHKLEQHSCKFCKKILKSQEDFETHLMEEHSSKDECQFCLRKFVCTNALRTHLKIHTSITHKVHQCKKCKQKFSTLKERSKHICLKLHCFFCDEAFGSDFDIEVHVAKDHTDQKIAKCNACSKLFPSRDAVKKHIKLKHQSKKTKSN